MKIIVEGFNRLPQEEILNACIGGILISVASSLNLVLTGRITGLSGIFFGAFSDFKNSYHRWCNMFGLLLISSIVTFYYGNHYHDSVNKFLNDISIIYLLIAAFLVGFGTKLSNGCTSGHGVCGLPRFSRRSITAVLVFLSCGVLTATALQYETFHKNGEQNYIDIAYRLNNKDTSLIIFTITCCVVGLLLFFQLGRRNVSKFFDGIISVSIGAIFGLGLIISGMVKRSKIINFLTFTENWDPTLIFVLMSAVGLNLLTFNFIINKVDKPIAVNEIFEIPKNRVIDLKLFLGAAIFGIGWGIGGLCPGPAIINSYLYMPHLILYIFVMFLGQLVAEKFGYYIENSFLNRLKLE